MGALKMPALPTWEEAERSRSANTRKGMTAIERMVLDSEPAGEDEVKFRDDLQAALQEAFDMGMARQSAAVRPAWIVNDNAELGVEIAGRCFFLYKGDSLEYEDGKHDDGTPIKYRIVGKVEFGECCHPVKFLARGMRLPERYTDNLVFTPGLSFGDPADADWRPLPIVECASTLAADEHASDNASVPFALRKMSEFQAIGDLSVGGTALNVRQQVWLSLVAGALGDSNIDGKDAVDVADAALDLVLDRLEGLS